MTTQTERVRTLEQVHAFVEGCGPVDFADAGRDGVYTLVRRRLGRLDYHLLGKSDKGLVGRYLRKVTGLSNGHLYNPRKSRTYRAVRRVFEPTRPTGVAIGERRKPDPWGEPGHLRVNRVHQGD